MSFPKQAGYQDLAPDDAALGERHTAILIAEYAKTIAENQLSAATAGKALLAAGVQISLRGAARADVAAMLRLAADFLERGGEGGLPN